MSEDTRTDQTDLPDLPDTDPGAITTVDAEPPTVEQLAEKTFEDYGVEPAIAGALAKVGITHPFPIQAMTLPVALSGHDIIGQAKTGTGKTLGFGIPLLQRVSGPGEPGWDSLEAPGRPQALVVVPTRELAVQVAGDLGAASVDRAARVVTVYGGRAYEPQVEALTRGAEIIVGTPGRLLDLAQQGHLVLGHARGVVLDEADEMLDLGFLPDVERLLSLTPAGRHTMLFSATMPGAVVALARRYMTQPTHIRASSPDDAGHTVAAVTQFVYRAHAMDKIEVLSRILQSEGRGRSIVFARTKRTAANVADQLTERGFAAGSLHGDLGQGAREQALRAFRNGKIDVLVATDVAARGIDVDDVTHVVNYQAPDDEKTYLHRIGRTARAGNKGTAVTFVDWDELPRWSMVNKTLDLGMPQPQETYSTSPHLFADLNIPEGTRGVLPRSRRTLAGLGAEELEDLGETGKRPSSGGGRGGRDGRSGGRDGGRDGGRGEGRGEGRGARSDGSDGERPPRQRRRTRGGAGEGGEAATEGSSTSSAPAGSSAAASGEGEQGSGDAPRRRRRRRGGRGRGGASDAPSTGTEA